MNRGRPSMRREVGRLFSMMTGKGLPFTRTRDIRSLNGT